MNFLAVFLPVFLILFLVVPSICFFVRIESKFLRRIYPERRRNRRLSSNNSNLRIRTDVIDRQGNIFTISDEAGGPQNYPDFFVLEPNSQVRSPLDKDDKDLPTYEEVMALSNLTAPTAAAAGSITPTILPNNLPMEVPPYTETDPNPIATTSGGTFTVAIPAANNSSMPPATTTLPEPSTSRNVAAAAATSTVVVTTATGTAANV